ncbi:MAG TPA: hypothetical protein VH142_26235 [Polyangiaceae bacterium]|jgi:hypothetical protein|nr:hypothetical protein [Polyangiaceae bacterium]
MGSERLQLDPVELFENGFVLRTRWHAPNLLATAILLSVACTPHPQGPAGPIEVTAAVSDGVVERLMPLEDRTVYTYDTKSENSAEHGVLIVQISRPRPDRADLRMGSRIERLQLEPGAITFVEGGYLLKAPIAKGSRWHSKFGIVEVVDADEQIDVPAGRFVGCVRTVEREDGTGASKQVTSVYCPHVGLVLLDAQAVGDQGLNRETAVLKSFGARVDLTNHEVTTTTEDDK